MHHKIIIPDLLFVFFLRAIFKLLNPPIIHVGALETVGNGRLVPAATATALFSKPNPESNPAELVVSRDSISLLGFPYF